MAGFVIYGICGLFGFVIVSPPLLRWPWILNRLSTMRDTSLLQRFLDGIERAGNRLPDPAMLFALLLAVVVVLSALLSSIEFSALHPATGQPLTVTNLLAPQALTAFTASLVTTFTNFAPLGVVLVAMLGVGVAERSGFINAAIKQLLAVTPRQLLTPVLVAVGIASHSAVDAGYVLVIPLGAVIFMAAGRHPLAGIAAAFAGVSGGFAANFLPSALDPLLQGFTQSAAQILDPAVQLNPLNNYFFTSASSLLVIGLCWWLTDKVVEPRLARTPLDGDGADAPALGVISDGERRALRWASLTLLAGIVVLVLSALPATSAWREPASGSLTAFKAPLMQSIVALIFLLFLLPGLVFGFVSGQFRSTKDLVAAMSKTMEGMGYYLVMAFFCAQFIKAFADSQLGTLLAVEGGMALQALALPGPVMLVGILLLVAFLNLFIGSASAKWGLLAPIFVPMLMQVGFSPDLTQAAYRVGDSTTNIITPLMPYFPLVVIYCQRYVKNTGIGTLVAMMLPYSLVLTLVWTLFLILYWQLGMPLGMGASYSYPAP